MGILDTAVDHRAQSYLEERSAALGALASLEAALDAARDGGGERTVTRHHARGKLLARERIELLVDRDSPLLELNPVAGWGTGAPVGAAVVTALGVVAEKVCVIVANEPTLPVDHLAAPAGALRKLERAQQVAWENSLPLISLAEAGVAAPPHRSDQAADEAGLAAYRQVGTVVAGFARLSAAGVPTVGVLFGEPPAESAAAGSFDYTIAVRSAPRRATRLADHLAEDERDALRLARQCAARFPVPRRAAPAAAVDPKHDPEDLLAVPGGDPWEILARLLDGSGLDELQPGYGTAVCTGWGEVHGHPVAVLAYTRAVRREEETQKAVRIVRLAGRTGTPVLLLQQGTAPHAESEAALAGAVAAAGVPLLSVRVGGWWGVPAVAALARFRFAWPGTVAGLPGDAQPAEIPALALSGWLDDDGIIDPRDTRTVLGLCLSVAQGRGAR